MTPRKVAMQAGGTLAILFGMIAFMVTLDPVWTLATAVTSFAIGAIAFGLAARGRN